MCRGVDGGGRSCPRKAMPNLAGSDVRVELAYGEEMRWHRSLFNPKDVGKWRFAPYGEGGGAIVDARPVSSQFQQVASYASVSVVETAEEAWSASQKIGDNTKFWKVRRFTDY